MFDLIGKKLGAYEIGEPVGQGGMATVYKAYQPSMNRTVAIKVLPPQLAQNATFLARFRREAQVIAHLEHAHILPVYDYGESDGSVYIAMRYLDSGSLQKRIDAGRMPLRDIHKHLTQIASALDYAHQQGVVHRDIKPTNVLIDRQGDAFLTDFGIAKMVEGTLDLTGTGVIGTPQYMSPEQGQGLEVDGRSDVYSLGIVLYEMLTGRLPFEAETPLAVVVKHITAPLPPARTFAPDLPEAIEAVLNKTLAKKPEDRYTTAGELAAALDQAIRTGVQPQTKPYAAVHPLTEPSDSARPTVIAPGRIRLPRPARVSLLVGVVFLALIGAFAAIINKRPPEPTPQGPSAGATTGTNIIVLPPDTTATPTPAGATSTPAPGANAGCTPIFVDDFGDPSGGFPRGESNRAAWGYVDGEYRIFMKLANEFEAPSLRRTFADYAVEVDAHFASDVSGVYGLVLGADAATTSYYAFVVDNARNFAVTRREPSGATPARDWTFAPSLNTGNTINRLRAVHKGNVLAVSGNGVLLAAITDTLNLPESRIGLIASSFSQGGADVRFDNFRVCPAPESLSPTDVSLADAFDDDRNLWGAVRYARDLSAFIQDGQFQLSVPYQDPAYQLFHWNPTFAVGDFELEVDSQLLEGPATSRAGVMFGIQDINNNYIVYASGDGLLSFYKRVDGDQQAIVLDRPTEAISIGNTVNHWAIGVKDGLLTISINSQQVLQASIAYDSGAIGFACEPGEPPLARCAFDNLSVRGKPSMGVVVVSPLCNCQRDARVGQPIQVAWLWLAADTPYIETFVSSISMTVTVDGRLLADPMQYWSPVETQEDGVQTRWAYPMPALDPGSHIVEVNVSSQVELTDGRDANLDGRPDVFGPGDLFKGFVQIVVSP
ncbi:MAG TPA: serine/threonine-protein kinase [Anaerolineae bacterium]